MISDEQDNIKCIFVQLAAQRTIYQQYGEVVELDATHNATDVPMPLYTLLVTKNFGVGKPVRFFFVSDDIQDNITIELKQFGLLKGC